MIPKARHYRVSKTGSARTWRRRLLALVFVIAIASVLQFLFRHLFFYPLRISTDSMQPEIASGDKRYFASPRLVEPRVGDIVLIELASAEVQLLCRVIAADGDKVEVKEGRLYINGNEARSLNPAVALPADLAWQFAEIEVRPEHVFCLNDNARNTNDSRLHGSFSRRQIEAILVKPRFFF